MPSHDSARDVLAPPPAPAGSSHLKSSRAARPRNAEHRPRFSRMTSAVSTSSRQIYQRVPQSLARFLLLAAQVRASATRRAPIRAGTAGSLPDLAPGPAAAFRSVFHNMPALQSFQLPPLAA